MPLPAPLKAHSLLEIHSFQLALKIGLNKKERLKSQKIAFDLTIYFLKPPRVYKTKKITETVCYDQICTHIRRLTKGQVFSLMENMSYHVWKNIKGTLPRYCRLKLTATKINPPISQLKKGVSYTIHDH